MFVIRQHTAVSGPRTVMQCVDFAWPGSTKLARLWASKYLGWNIELWAKILLLFQQVNRWFFASVLGRRGRSTSAIFVSLPPGWEGWPKPTRVGRAGFGLPNGGCPPTSSTMCWPTPRWRSSWPEYSPIPESSVRRPCLRSQRSFASCSLCPRTTGTRARSLWTPKWVTPRSVPAFPRWQSFRRTTPRQATGPNQVRSEVWSGPWRKLVIIF